MTYGWVQKKKLLSIKLSTRGRILKVWGGGEGDDEKGTSSSEKSAFS
jgi:hypothetical protein